MNPIHNKPIKILTVHCIRQITVRTKHLKTHTVQSCIGKLYLSAK